MTMRLGTMLAGAAHAGESGKSGAAKQRMVVVAPSDAKWEDAPAPLKGIQRAPIKGNPAKGAHASFIKFQGGTDNPPHTHTNTLRSVVISGAFYQGPDAAAATDLPAGTYFETRGGRKHVSGCRAGSECVLYEESRGKFDFKPAGGKQAAE